jgi:hypothetical protein
MAAAASPIRTDGGSSAVIARTPAQIPPNPAELAQKLLNENGVPKKPNLKKTLISNLFPANLLIQ